MCRLKFLAIPRETRSHCSSSYCLQGVNIMAILAEEDVESLCNKFVNGEYGLLSTAIFL